MKDIPDFLKKSRLYNNLDNDDNEPISINKKYFKKELKIESINDFFDYIKIIDFWDIYDIQYEIFDYAYENSVNIGNILINMRNEILKDLFDKFYILAFLKKNLLLEAVKCGFLDILQYGIAKGYSLNKKLCTFSAGCGHLHILKFLHENNCPWDEETCGSAVSYGRLHCLKYAHENGAPWNEDTCLNSILGGNLQCLQYAVENGCPMYKDKDTCFNIAKDYSLKCLQYIELIMK